MTSFLNFFLFCGFLALYAKPSNGSIFIWDSGVGGMSVLEQMLGLDEFNNQTLEAGSDGLADFAGRQMTYFADRARFPYGVKGHKQLRTIGLSLYRDLEMKKMPLVETETKLLVIGCNSASTAFPDVATSEFPVVNVIDAAIEELVARKSEVVEGTVAVLATKATVTSEVYRKKISKQLRRVDIVEQKAPGLADLIEGGVGEENKDRISKMLGVFVDKIIEKIKQEQYRPLKAIVFGCTHYPLVANELREQLHLFATKREDGHFVYRNFISEGILLVDPAKQAAIKAFQQLAPLTKGFPFDKAERVQFLQTSKEDAGARLWKEGLYVRSMTCEDLDSSMGLIKYRLPTTYSKLNEFWKN